MKHNFDLLAEKNELTNLDVAKQESRFTLLIEKLQLKAFFVKSDPLLVFSFNKNKKYVGI